MSKMMHSEKAAWVGAFVTLMAFAACGGPQIDRTGWECWEEMPCEAGFLCSETHLASLRSRTSSACSRPRWLHSTRGSWR